jgi:N-carbamoylputrescine amidase
MQKYLNVGEPLFGEPFSVIVMFVWKNMQKSGKMRFTLACAQIVPDKGHLQKNLDHVAETVDLAQQEGVGLVLFPEACTTGYFIEGGVYDDCLSIDQLQNELSKRLGKITAPIDIALGFYEIDQGTVYNSAVYFEWTGKILELKHLHRKLFLPTYGVFDEERFVAKGSHIQTFDTRFGKACMLICEDIWHSVVPTIAALQGAEILLIPTASPARNFYKEKPDNILRIQNLLTNITQEHNVFCAASLLYGFEGGKGLSGGSMIYNPLGEKIAESPLQEESLLLAEIDLDLIRVARSQSPLLSDLREALPLIKDLLNKL